MTRLNTLIAASLLAAAPAIAGAAEETPMQPYGEIYQGEKNETVEIGYYKDGKTALVQVKGVNHGWDNKVVKTTLENAGTGKDYVTQADGKAYHMLVKRDSAMDLNLPGYSENPVHLSFDKEASKEARPLHLYTAYKQSAK